MSAMVYQNIIIIIAVGVIRVIFGDYGWWYNETIIQIVNPVYHTILPVLIGFTGGKLIGGQKGGATAAIAIFGLTLSSTVPAILGAMIIGPISGWIIKKIDQHIIKRLPGAGYELLIGNIIIALIAFLFTLICYLYIGKIFSAGTDIILQWLGSIASSSLLPLVAIFVEPAKVLFFNNVVNFGILAPLGIHQVNELGKSIFFLIESNPGPGLGILLAYWLKTKGEQRKGAKLATFVHFFGGIHEVYFPYVLKKPRLIIAVMIGGMVGVYCFQQFQVGLVAISSPGSALLLTALSPRADMLLVLLSILLSGAASFLISIVLLNRVAETPTVNDTKETINTFYRLTESGRLPRVNERNTAHFAENVQNEIELDTKMLKGGTIRSIYFVCEAGIGSSAMGGAMLRKKLQQANLPITVENASINDIPEDADLIVCHERLLPTIEHHVPNKIYYPLKSFTDMKVYDQLVQELR